MTVKIGHARHTEYGGAHGGRAGDQGGEVAITNWYQHPKGWYVYRCKDASKRKKIAVAARAACNNNNIGYDQYQRDTLFNTVKHKDYDPARVTSRVETDCSALVRVCIAYAYGKDLVGNIRTATMSNALLETGEFYKYKSAKYCKKTSYLRRGDILCTRTSGHTVVVLTDGAKIGSEPSRPSKLRVDGSWGQDTTELSQKVFGTRQDGIVSRQPLANKECLPNCHTSSWKFKRFGCKGGSSLIKAIQRYLNKRGCYSGAIDGFCGRNTVKGMQRLIGGKVDGSMGPATVKAWQEFINSRL